MIIIIIILSVLLILGIVGVIFIDDYDFELIHTICFFSNIILSIVLPILLIIWPINYFDGKSKAQQYYAIKQTIEQSRSQQISEIERAALTTKIIEVNQDLASAKYWNKTIFDDFIYDGYADLPYLK